MRELNKRGFTIIEMLATIVILGIMAGIAVGAVYIHAQNSREQAMETIASTSYDGMVNYMMEHGILLNPAEQSGNSRSIGIDELFDEGYIERPSDPYNSGGLCSGTVTVTNESSSTSTGIDDYRYDVHVECSGDHVLDVTY